MKVVSDSGPLMALAKIGALGALPRLYGQAVMAGAVYIEVVVRGRDAGCEDADVVAAAIAAGDLTVAQVDVAAIPEDLAALPLDPGEIETIALAQREGADLVLMDERKARQEARARRLVTRGTLGVLLEASRSGVLTEQETARFIRATMERDDIWIAAELCQAALASLAKP